MKDKDSNTDIKSTNIVPVAHRVQQKDRHAQNAHGGGVLWLTGLSGAGKSTLAFTVEELLFRKGYQVYVLDGDNIRLGLNKDLGFSPTDRTENVRRIGEVAALFADAGFIVIAALISPFIRGRQAAKIAAKGNFHEFYIKADLGVCESRDTKGLYKRARKGEIKDFAGISMPYEPPVSADLVIDTQKLRVEACVAMIERYCEQHFKMQTQDDS